MDPMQEIEARAEESVQRGCAFAVLGIACLMMGLSYDPLLAAETGAILTSLLAVVLILKARMAPRRSHKQTELWALLDERHRPPEPQAQRILMRVLKDAYLRYARAAGVGASAFWVCSLGLMVVT